jgi:hypothetical protein
MTTPVATSDLCVQNVAAARKILLGIHRKVAGTALTEISTKLGGITRSGDFSERPKVSVAPMMDWTDDVEMSGSTWGYDGQKVW